MNKKILVLLFLSIFIIGCETKSIEERMPKCDNPSQLSCEDVSDCLDECNNEGLITWSVNCRGKFSSYVIAKCGTSE